jgi:hypothetical protein
VRRAPTTILVAALLLTACSGGADDDLLELQATEEPAASVEDPDRSPSPEEEPEPEDPYAVPDEIDEAYVERVINAILEVQAEVLRGALTQMQGENLDPSLMELHFATTDGQQRALGLDEYQSYIDEPETRGGLFDDLDDDARGWFAVEYLHHAEPDGCVLALGYWDRTELSANAPSREETLTALSLSRIADGEEVSRGNPTPWRWRHNLGVDGDLTPDEWPALPWDSSLDHTCDFLADADGAEG